MYTTSFNLKDDFRKPLLLVKYKTVFVSIKVGKPFIVSFCCGTVI